MYQHTCFACNKLIKAGNEKLVDTKDAQLVFIGPECYKKVVKAGDKGYQPPLGGPRLFLIKPD